MLRKIFLPLVLAVFGAQVHAQSVPVQSGEHETFSRLVFLTELGQEWQIDRSGRSASIEFARPLPQLDLSKVFYFIPKDRLTSLTATEAGLSLSLSCECGISVFQLQSGHIVVDITDDADTASLAQSSAIPLEMPPLNIPLLASTADLLARRGERTSSTNAAVVANPAEPGQGPVSASPVQIKMHPSGSISLLPIAKPSTPLKSLACPFEKLSREVLLADPSDAVTSLPQHLSGVLNGRDGFERDAALELALSYLKAGWGAEAGFMIRSADLEAPMHLQIADALDERATGAQGYADPGCGPASAIIALLEGNPEGRWDRADELAVVQLLADLPQDRWNDIRDRIAEALSSVGASDLLVGLRQESSSAGAPAPTPPAAGTDLSAVESVLDMLVHANASSTRLSTVEIGNALAFLPSIPPNEKRAQIKSELARALLRAEYFHEAIDLVGSESAEAEALLGLALQEMPIEKTIEFAVRLRPYLSSGSEGARRVADVLRSWGFEDAAARFDAVKSPEEARNKAGGFREAKSASPWLTRNFPEMARSDSETGPRTDLARLIVLQNEEATTKGDLSSAQQALEHSRALSEAIAAIAAASPAR
ncbi:hypothetical protein [Jannaschia seosinensis]|nr:hypothetical protein [Jannaschia seosinensis]